MQTIQYRAISTILFDIPNFGTCRLSLTPPPLKNRISINFIEVCT